MSYTTIRGLMTGIADAVREKEGSSALIQNQDLPARIAAIKTGMSWEDWIDDVYDPDVVLTGTHRINRYKLCHTRIDSITGPAVVTFEDNAVEQSTVKIVNLPNATGTLGMYCFSECDLQEVALGVSAIGQYAFSRCEDLTTVSLPNCTQLGYMSFNSCTSLASFSAPNLDEIGSYAFQYDSALKTFTFGGSTIGAFAFFYGGLETLHLTGQSVVTLGSNAFPSSLSAIYVPAALVETYKTATNWSQYANIIYPEV